jgi:hypothetical protein
LVALVLGAAAPLAAAAAQPSAQPAPDSDNLRLAQKLVGVINPHDLMVDVNFRGWEATIGQLLAAQPQVQKLEAAHPGITKAGIDAARPLARLYCEEFVRGAVDAKARLFAASLNRAEMLDGLAFFGGPVGQRLIRSYTANADVQELGRRLTVQVQETGKPKLTTEMAADLQHKAIQGATEEITAADQIELMRFSQKPAARKIAELGAEADRQLIAELNKPKPEWEAKQAAIINDAMLAFVDARKKP